jgi:predicted enzyme related to lactoylglutathione lyase
MKPKSVKATSPSTFFVVEEIQKEVRRLKSKGVEFTKEIHKMPWGGYQATFSDSDGNKMNITQHPKGGPIM